MWIPGRSKRRCNAWFMVYGLCFLVYGSLCMVESLRCRGLDTREVEEEVQLVRADRTRRLAPAKRDRMFIEFVTSDRKLIAPIEGSK